MSLFILVKIFFNYIISFNVSHFFLGLNQGEGVYIIIPSLSKAAKKIKQLGDVTNISA